MVAGDPIHAGPGQTRTAENIAATDNDTELHAERHNFFQLGSNTGQHVGIDAVVPATHEDLAAELQQDAPVEQTSLVHAIKTVRCPLGGCCKIRAILPDLLPCEVNSRTGLRRCRTTGTGVRAPGHPEAQPPECMAATASAIFSDFFSMPSPTSRRTKALHFGTALLEQLLDRRYPDP